MDGFLTPNQRKCLVACILALMGIGFVAMSGCWSLRIILNTEAAIGELVGPLLLGWLGLAFTAYLVGQL